VGWDPLLAAICIQQWVGIGLESNFEILVVIWVRTWTSSKSGTRILHCRWTSRLLQRSWQPLPNGYLLVCIIYPTPWMYVDHTFNKVLTFRIEIFYIYSHFVVLYNICELYSVIVCLAESASGNHISKLYWNSVLQCMLLSWCYCIKFVFTFESAYGQKYGTDQFVRELPT